MRRNILLSTSLFLLLAATFASAQPGTTTMTPHRDAPLVAKKLVVPEKYRGLIDTNRIVYLPAGWTAKVFYIGSMIDGTRFMTWGPDSVLYVANMNNGNVIALPDANRDGVADEARVAATQVPGHDLEFYNGALYVAQTGRVTKLTDDDGNGMYEPQSTFINNIPTGGGHVTRTIVFDSVRGKVYLSIGSSCNVCREDNRAIIQEYNINGTGGRTYASGIRNAVGMTLHPRTGRLWATNNGSDMLGNDIPPEWIDIVRDGGFYGWPFAHSNQVYNNFDADDDYRALLPITSEDSARVRMMVQPAALVQAHSALMAIEFPNSNAFPAEYRRGAFVVSRGSWNRTPATGYKIIYLDFDNDQDTTANTASDFMTGFLTDSSGGHWARPVGLLSDMRGNLYLTSNATTQFVLMISPESTTGSVDRHEASGSGTSLGAAYPNPASGSVSIPFFLASSGHVRLHLIDLLGREVATMIDGVDMEAGPHDVSIDTRDIPAGTYFYRLSVGDDVRMESLVVTR